ncbi:MAG: hypothetical protein ACXWXA_09650 [Candidatus Limnocylindrales bacterium]
MTRRLVGAFVAAAFALGFLSGAAGTIVAHDNTRNRDLVATMAEHMAGYDMDTMMSGSMSSMMSGSMMGSGSSFNPGSMMGPGMMSGPGASSMPGSQHELHHPAASQDVPQ